MKNNFDTEQNSVKNRLLDFLKYKGISQSKFEQQCGISNGYVNNIRKGIKNGWCFKKYDTTLDVPIIDIKES